MFEQVIVERIKMDHRTTSNDEDGINSFMKPVQFKLPILDRFTLRLGDMMIRIGVRLMQRSQTSLVTEQAHSPTFMIML